MTTVHLLERALEQTGVIVERIAPNQLDLPTPCKDWNVRTVIAHLVRGNENTAAVAEGRPRQPSPIADVGDDPKGAYRTSARTVKEAWRDESRLDAEYMTPLGPMPGRALLALRLADNVTHGWDLARATGQTPRYDDDVVQAAVAFAEAQLVGNRGPGGAFAPAVSAPEDVPAIDRLAAFLGRQP
jgi:uncharacterized protein (TIGR03086 family)